MNSSADPADPADQANQVSLSAARSLPSTRAGGQDDVSFNKLPQIIICFILFIYLHIFAYIVFATSMRLGLRAIAIVSPKNEHVS